MKVVLSGCVVLLVMLGGVPAQALEPLVHYDDFNTKLIDPDKWVGGEFEAGGREAVRLIQGNRLRLANRAYGDTDSDSGARVNVFVLDMTNRTAVTAIKATVRVKKFETTGCPSNPDVTFVRASLTGSFFNTGTPTPGSIENDVLAIIDIRAASDAPGLRVQAFVFRCEHPSCFFSTLLDSKDLGPINAGQKAMLRVQWDPDNDQFIFQRDDGPEVFSPYTVPDTNPPGLPLKRLENVHVIPNCTAKPRAVSFMDAFFDDVFVNESAAP